MNENSKYLGIGTFDLAKGFFMILIVVGHSAMSAFDNAANITVTNQWILLLFFPLRVVMYGAVPLFFLISGYGFRPRKMKSCIEQQTRYILKPYLYVTVAVLSLLVLKRVIDRRSILELLIYQGVPFILALCPERRWGSVEIGSIGPLWFMIALYNSWIILNLAYQEKRKWIRWLVVLLITLTGYMLSWNLNLPFCIQQSMIAAGFLCVGYEMKKSRFLEDEVPKYLWCMVGAFLLVVIHFGEVGMSHNIWRLGVLDIMASCLAGILLLRICVFCNRFEHGILDKVRIIGRYSLWVCCLHTIEYVTFPWKTFNEMMVSRPLAGFFLKLLIRSVFIWMGCMALNWWKNRTRKDGT